MKHKYRQVNSKFWSDVWIVDDLNPLDRYLFLYFMTNEYANDLLIYEISKRTIAHQTGIEKDEVERMMKRLENKIIYFNGFIIFKRGINNKSYNPNQFIGMSTMLLSFPDNVIEKASNFVVVQQELKKKIKGLKGFERLIKGLSNDNEHEHEHEHDNEHEQEQGIIPTVENEIEVLSDAQLVFDHWNSVEIIKHQKLTKDIKASINKKLKEYDYDQLITAIDTFGTVYHGADYFWSYRWTLSEFLDRKTGFLVFMHKTPNDYKKTNINQKQMYVAS